MKKLLLLFSVGILLGSSCAISGVTKKPPIVDFFACGDSCPGPAENYTVKVYEGVTDKEACLKLGGEPESFIGLGRISYCKVK